MEHTFSGLFEEIDGYFMAWIEELPVYPSTKCEFWQGS
jgi:hypothetical protein